LAELEEADGKLSCFAMESKRISTSPFCLRCLVLEAERDELLASLEEAERSPCETACSSVSLVSAREASIPDNVPHVSTAAPLNASLDTCDVGPLEVVQPRMRQIEALPYKSCLKAPESQR